MINISRTLSVPSSLLEECKRAFKTDKFSKAIIYASHYFLLFKRSGQKLDNFVLHQIVPDVEKRRDLRKITVRIPKPLYNEITELRGNKTLSETVTCMLSQTLYMMTEKKSSNIRISRLIYILGNKWDEKMQEAIKTILESTNATWNISVETCAGALGIYSNFKFAMTEILNDSDWNKINLYRAIYKNHFKLIEQAWNLEVNSETFAEQKELYDKSQSDGFQTSSDVDYKAAVSYLFVCLNSYRKNCKNLDTKANIKKFRKSLCAIYPLHNRMKQAENISFGTENLLNLIDSHRRKENVLFIVDPPYLDADIYNDKEHQFGLEEHQRLAKLLTLTKQNNGNDFIYFCRITAIKKYQNKVKKDEHNCHMKGRIDDLYYGHGFYYKDVKQNANVTERIITSFSFKGATFYGKGCD